MEGWLDWLMRQQSIGFPGGAEPWVPATPMTAEQRREWGMDVPADTGTRETFDLPNIASAAPGPGAGAGAPAVRDPMSSAWAPHNLIRGLFGAAPTGSMQPATVPDLAAYGGPQSATEPDLAAYGSDQPGHDPQSGIPMPPPRPREADGAGEPLALAPGAQLTEGRLPGQPLDIRSEPQRVMDAGGQWRPGPPAAAAQTGGGGFQMPGFLSRLLDPANAPMLLALGAGFSGAPSVATGARRAFAAAAPLAERKQILATKLGGTRALYGALVARGVPQMEALAASQNPGMLKIVASRYLDGKPFEVKGRVVQVQGDGSVKTLADFSEDKAPAGFEWRNVDGARGLHFIKGGPADPAYKRAAGERQNVPPGYEYADANDPSKGLKAIAGGPATRLSAEVAGRIAAMKVASADLPAAREALMKGRTGTGTGLGGIAESKLNIYETGRAQRTVRAAIEAALRTMTGAAAPEQEVTRYLDMYMPSPLDSRETAAQKLNLLQGFMDMAEQVVTQGRVTTAPGAAAPPASGKVSGVTASGIPYSVD